MSHSTIQLINEYMQSAESYDLVESTREQKIRLFDEIARIFTYVEDFNLNEYKIHLLATGKKKISVNSYVAMVRPIFEWAVREEWIIKNPFKGHKKYRVPKSRIRVFKSSQIEAVFDVLHSSTRRYWSMIWEARILAALTAGLRRAEVLNLKIDDIDFDNGSICVQPKSDSFDTWQWMPKNKKYRVVPLVPRLYNVLVSKVIPSLPAGYQYLMLTPKRYKELQQKRQTRPLPYRIRLCPDENFTKPFRDILDDANINGLSFHDLRKTCITKWTQNPNLSPQEVKELAGHASIVTTMEYYAAIRDDVCQRAKQTTIGATGLEPATS